MAVDCFGEQVSQHDEAVDAAAAYDGLAAGLAQIDGTADAAVDLSHIGLDVDPALCLAHLERIAGSLPPGRRVQIGAEDAPRTDRVLAVATDAARAGLPIEVTLQANLRRTSRDWPGLADLGVPIRLVKGAYVESAADAVPYGEPTDRAFLALSRSLHEAGAAFSLATHDAALREAALAEYGPRRVEMLLGVRPHDATELVGCGVATRIYVPYGQRWLRYLLRRLAEAEGA